MTQFFAPLAEPVGAIWFLTVLALIALLWRRQWRSALWLSFPVILLFVTGSTSVSDMLATAEERQWATRARGTMLDDGAPADAVVALGGGQRVSEQDPLGFAMEDRGSRVLTAVQLVRLGRARTLVLGGSWPMPNQPEIPSMCVVQNWIVSWGLCAGPVTNLGICVNTHDEAIAFSKMARQEGWSRIALITSALHMRRSVALFKKQGLQVIPVAADFQADGVSRDLPFSPFPREQRMDLLALYLHEKIGWWVYRLKGWI